MKSILIIFLLNFIQNFANAQTNSGMAKITGGSFIPLYGSDKKFVSVNDFYIDTLPVTVSQYLTFTKKNTSYKKSKIKRLFAEETYLYNWKNDSIPEISLQLPITYVSWFSAKEYCECQGKRLATVNEWEYVAMANQHIKDARKDTVFNKNILAWYEKPSELNTAVGAGSKNYWGVYDLHELVWEWTNDFNSVIISGEGRNKQNDKNLFCGAGSYSASDLTDYAAFMRYAFRSSVKANYTLKNLGFRCAKSIN